MLRFSATTGFLVLLLALGLCFGGIWPTIALLYITVFTFFMDKLAALCAPDDPGREFPVGTGLSVTLGIAHFGLLFYGVAILASENSLSIGNKALMFIALSLFFGQVSNSNAHELIHRSARPLRQLGTGIYASLLFGHHVSAHTRVHHVHAATDSDPNSARMGEGFYRFAARAWVGSFREGWRAETALRRRAAAPRFVHPYVVYAVGSALTVLITALIAQKAGVAVLLGFAIYAQVQLLLSDYVQHYGLRRRQLGKDKWEPVGPQHSWNAPNGFSSSLMLNAPRHSDHHAHPSRSYPGLRLERSEMPFLPHSLPVMAVLALVPPVWRRVMTPRAKAWNGGESALMPQA